MTPTGFDPQALIDLFARTTAQQTDQLRQGVYQATLGALQGRDLSLANIRQALGSVAQAASTGAAKNPMAGVDATGLLDNAVAGMDDALLKAVEANQLAMQQLVQRGAEAGAQPLQAALGNLEKMEDALLAAVQQAAGAAGDPMAGPWGEVLAKLHHGATQTGHQASTAAQQFTAQLAQMQATLRDSRAAGLQVAQTLADSYTALVSGVLIGMSDALRQGVGGVKKK